MSFIGESIDKTNKRINDLKENPKQDFGYGFLTKSFMPSKEELDEERNKAVEIKTAKDLNIEHPYKYYSDLNTNETNT